MLTDMFRPVGSPIVWVCQEFKPDLSDAFQEMRRKDIRITIEGTHGAKIIAELLPQSYDHRVIKKRYSAFFGTNLDQLITEHDADTLVLAASILMLRADERQ